MKAILPANLRQGTRHTAFSTNYLAYTNKIKYNYNACPQYNKKA